MQGSHSCFQRIAHCEGRYQSSPLRQPFREFGGKCGKAGVHAVELVQKVLYGDFDGVVGIVGDGTHATEIHIDATAGKQVAELLNRGALHIDQIRHLLNAVVIIP